MTFIGHDRAGAELARDVLRRLRASQRTIDYVAALTLHHLRLGFLVHERPLDRRTVWRYLRATAPCSADVTIFTVADRLATRGRNADEAIAAHLEVAREMLDGRAAGRPSRWSAATSWRASSASPAGPKLGEILAQLEEDRFAGAVATREDALARARELLGALLGSRAMPDLDRSILGEVADDVQLGPFCVVAEGARIGAGSRLGAHVIVHPGTSVGAGCEVQDGAVLGKPPKLARHSRAAGAPVAALTIEDGAVICCGAIVFAGASIGAGAIIGDQAFVRERAVVGAGLGDRARQRGGQRRPRSARACACRRTST